MTPEYAAMLVGEERQRQRDKWGRAHEWGIGDCSQSTVAHLATDSDTADLLRLAVLVEEVGEVARAVLERHGLREELVQVAAVCAAWLEAK